jgi:hypothetical protein
MEAWTESIAGFGQAANIFMRGNEFPGPIKCTKILYSEDLLDSQEELCSKELVYVVFKIPEFTFQVYR